MKRLYKPLLIKLIQDADLEYDPSDYFKLIEPIRNGYADVVYGSRFIGTDQKRVLNYWHSLGNYWLTLISNMLTNINLTDMEVCYKAFRTECIKHKENQRKTQENDCQSSENH